MSRKLLWGALLTLGPVSGMAQTTPRLYAGASAVLLRTAPFESYASTHVGPAATVGVQFSPRWAVETGLQAVWYTTTYSSNFVINNSTDFYSSTLRSTNFLVPLLARFTATAAESALRVDILGGLNWMHGTSHVNQMYTSQGLISYSEYKGSGNTVSVGVGPQLRYGLGVAGLEVKLNVPVNLRLNKGEYSINNRLFLNPQLGVQYAFN